LSKKKFYLFNKLKAYVQKRNLIKGKKEEENTIIFNRKKKNNTFKIKFFKKIKK
jgi:hypothetical protein